MPKGVNPQRRVSSCSARDSEVRQRIPKTYTNDHSLALRRALALSEFRRFLSGSVPRPLLMCLSDQSTPTLPMESAWRCRFCGNCGLLIDIVVTGNSPHTEMGRHDNSARY